MDTRSKSLLIRALRYTERYTKTDMVYLAQGGFWLTAGQAWAALSAFALSLVVARLLSPEVYGTYRYLISLVTIVGALSLTGIGTAVTQAVARGFEGALHRGFRDSLLGSLPSSLVLLCIAGYYALQGNLAFAIGIAIAAFATPIINAAALYGSYFGGTKDFMRQMTYWTFGNSLTVATMIAAILFTNDLVILLGAYFGSMALGNALLYARARRYVRNDTSEKTELRFAAHLSAISLLGTITSQIDRILIFQLLGPAQLAIYSFANAIPEQARAIVKAGSRLALPKFAERDFASIRATLNVRLFIFGLIVLAGSLLYAAAAPFLFVWLFPAYAESVPYSQAIALSLTFTVGTIALTALQAHARIPALYAHGIASNIAQIAATIFCISMWGLWGAVVALIFNRALQLALAIAFVAHAPESELPRTGD